MDQDHMKRDESETALQWLLRLKSPNLRISTGHAGFDELLGKSLPLMTVTEIAGDHGCGKLDLAMTIIAEMLLSREKTHWKAVVLDYSGTFRTSKLLGIIQHRSDTSESNRVALLERVYIERVYTPDEMESSFCKMIEEFMDKPYIPLVVVNNIGAILSDTSFMEENEAGLIQDRILKRMREFCELCGGTVISLNHVVNWRGFPTAALGNAWRNAPIITKRIILTRCETNGSLSARLESKDPTESRRVPYAITNRGFCAVAIEEFSVESENS